MREFERTGLDNLWPITGPSTQVTQRIWDGFGSFRGFLAPGATLPSYLLPLGFFEIGGICKSFLEIGGISNVAKTQRLAFWSVLGGLLGVRP
jgi:hypothetical protein